MQCCKRLQGCVTRFIICPRWNNHWRSQAHDFSTLLPESDPGWNRLERLPSRLIGTAAATGTLVLLDTETTGLPKRNEVHQVIELSMVTYENGEKANDIKTYRFCPTVAKMSPGAAATHGISMEQLRGEPTFESKAVEIRDTLAQANSLMGYNLRFDIKMLQAEFCTAGVEPLALAGVAIIDPFFIWDAQRRKCKGERRKLVNAHQVFLGEPMENAHNAAADIIATAHVYNAMVEDFHLAGLDGAAIDRMYRGNKIDFEGKFVRNPQGEVVFNFGQHKGMAVVDPSFKSYLDWMVSRGDFFPDARRIAELARKFSTDKDTFNATIGDSHRQHVLA